MARGDPGGSPGGPRRAGVPGPGAPARILLTGQVLFYCDLQADFVDLRVDPRVAKQYDYMRR